MWSPFFVRANIVRAVAAIPLPTASDASMPSSAETFSATAIWFGLFPYRV